MALAGDDAALELRCDPFGVAPERALVFVTAVSIGDLARAARLVGLEVLSEIELEEDYDLPNDLIAEHPGAVSPTLYATISRPSGGWHADCGSPQPRWWRCHRRCTRPS